jgi:hypothetical protein
MDHHILDMKSYILLLVAAGIFRSYKFNFSKDPPIQDLEDRLSSDPRHVAAGISHPVEVTGGILPF